MWWKNDLPYTLLHLLFVWIDLASKEKIQTWLGLGVLWIHNWYRPYQTISNLAGREFQAIPGKMLANQARSNGKAGSSDHQWPVSCSGAFFVLVATAYSIYDQFIAQKRLDYMSHYIYLLHFTTWNQIALRCIASHQSTLHYVLKPLTKEIAANLPYGSEETLTSNRLFGVSGWRQITLDLM